MYKKLYEGLDKIIKNRDVEIEDLLLRVRCDYQIEKDTCGDISRVTGEVSVDVEHQEFYEYLGNIKVATKSSLCNELFEFDSAIGEIGEALNPVKKNVFTMLDNDYSPREALVVLKRSNIIQ